MNTGLHGQSSDGLKQALARQRSRKNTEAVDSRFDNAPSAARDHGMHARHAPDRIGLQFTSGLNSTAPARLGTIAQIEATNKGSQTMQTTNALHTYYRVADATSVKVEGLESIAYYDNADARKHKEGSAEGPKIEGFTDRIYADTGADAAATDIVPPVESTQEQI